MWPLSLLVSYCVLIAGVSFLGGRLPALFSLTHTRMQVVMSFVGGLMLGVALLRLLPHSIEHAESLSAVMAYCLVGLLVMFFLIRIFHVHQHPSLEQDDLRHVHHDHHQCDHEHDPPDCHSSPLSWIGLAAGLSLHTIIDGVGLAAAVTAVTLGQPESRLPGLGIFLAILLHKPLDALSITSVMIAGGWSLRPTKVVGALFSLMCPLGAALFYLGSQHLFVEQKEAVIGSSLAFAAGVFLCISLADILPEVRFHRHDRVKLSMALLGGVALAAAIGWIEPHGM